MTAIIHGRVDTKAYKEAMKKHGLLMPYITPRAGLKPDFPMALSPLCVHLKRSARMSVLSELGITGRILSRLKKKELKILHDMLHNAMLAVMIRRDKLTGTKTSFGITER